MLILFGKFNYFIKKNPNETIEKEEALITNKISLSLYFEVLTAIKYNDISSIR